MSKKTIVIARAGEDSDEFSQAITAGGYEPLFESILTIHFVDENFPDVTETTPLVFTSANGVRAFARMSDLRDNPVYTVGPNTADEAAQIGFKNIENAQGTVDDLADMLANALTTSLISPLYVHGAEISQDLTGILSKNGVSMQEWTGYKAVPVQNLSINLLKRLDNREIEGILFFSKRGGQVFTELMEQYDRVSRMRTTKALCISDSVLKSVSVLPFAQTLVAATPDRYGMMKLLQDLRN